MRKSSHPRNAALHVRGNGASVCTDEDVHELAETGTDAALAKVPNVVEREWLPAREPDAGRSASSSSATSASHRTAKALQRFVEQGWARLAQKVPRARLTIVGLHLESILALAQRHGFDVHANVPSLKPFYAGSDVVIAPILFGSGTRIKILEAMAYGRPVVSTSMGAEGLGSSTGSMCCSPTTCRDLPTRWPPWRQTRRVPARWPMRRTSCSCSATRRVRCSVPWTAGWRRAARTLPPAQRKCPAGALAHRESAVGRGRRGLTFFSHRMREGVKACARAMPLHASWRTPWIYCRRPSLAPSPHGRPRFGYAHAHRDHGAWPAIARARGRRSPTARPSASRSS